MVLTVAPSELDETRAIIILIFLDLTLKFLVTEALDFASLGN